MRPPFNFLLLVVALPAATRAQHLERPIQDNSFLLEEAYNQERGVVQHINTFTRPTRGPGWEYSFTQEWPLGGVRHQLSFTVPVLHGDGADGASDGTGAGDVLINYRYQLAGDGDARVAIAPRVSVSLPTGSEQASRGAGATGVLAAIPASVVLSRRIVTHTNATIGYTPGARNALGDRADAWQLGLGQSLVWLARPRINFLVELAWTRTQQVLARDHVAWNESLAISPGIRAALDFSSGLQIVPGLALPIGLGVSRGERAAFAYLSFEHPFSR